MRIVDCERGSPIDGHVRIARAVVVVVRTNRTSWYVPIAYVPKFPVGHILVRGQLLYL